MKRILSSIFYILFVVNSYAQYTTIINSNKPGKTETAYAVGKDVIQFENSLSYNSLQLNEFDYYNYKHNLNVRYGFFKERLEAVLNNDFTIGNQTTNYNQLSNISRLSIGLKYLLFDFNTGDTPEKYRSWKKRYSFWQNGILPAIAIAAHYNTPLSNENFSNAGQSSASISLIVQNNINQRLRIINQFDYNYIGADQPEFEYNLSSSYAFSERLNPYAQLGYRSSDLYSSMNVGIGLSFLINKDFTVSTYSDLAFGSDVSGFEFGINASYRLDYHEDELVYKESQLALEKDLEDEMNIDKELMEEEMGLNQDKEKKKSFFSKVFSIFKKKKDTSKKIDNKKESDKKEGFFKKLFKKKKKDNSDKEKKKKSKKKKKDTEDVDENKEIQDIISDF